MRSRSTRRISSSSEGRGAPPTRRGRGSAAAVERDGRGPAGSGARAALRRAAVRSIGAILLIGATGACGAGVLGPQREAFDAARSRWAAAGLDSYTFEVQRGCFCPPAYTRPMRVEVVDGSVSSAVYADDGSALPEHIEPPTVTDLFDEIHDAIEQEAHSLEATYDDRLGYPLAVSIDYSQQVADEEQAFQIHSLVPTGTPQGG